MTKTELHDLAVTTAKASLTENNPIELSNINVKAAKHHGVAPEDFPMFQQFVAQARNNYKALAVQKLPSEAKAKVPAAAPVPATKPEPTAAPAA